MDKLIQVTQAQIQRVRYSAHMLNDRPLMITCTLAAQGQEAAIAKVAQLLAAMSAAGTHS